MVLTLFQTNGTKKRSYQFCFIREINFNLGESEYLILFEKILLTSTKNQQCEKKSGSNSSLSSQKDRGYANYYV